MALTITRDTVYVLGDRKAVNGSITFDSSYPTGGESLTGADLKLELGLTVMQFEQHPSRIAYYDYTNKKAVLYTALGTEASDTSDQSSITVRYRAVGKGSAAA